MMGPPREDAHNASQARPRRRDRGGGTEQPEQGTHRGPDGEGLEDRDHATWTRRRREATTWAITDPRSKYTTVAYSFPAI